MAGLGYDGFCQSESGLIYLRIDQNVECNIPVGNYRKQGHMYNVSL